MDQIKAELDTQIGALHGRIKTDPVGVIDPAGQHSEFASGAHGQKVDIDKIQEGTDFYNQLIDTYHKFILYKYGEPELLVGIANGANRLARDIGYLLGVNSIETEKNDDKKSVRLSELGRTAVKSASGLILLVEDVGTTGGTTASVVPEIIKECQGRARIEVVHALIRTPSLPRLDAMDVPYTAMIHEELPMFNPEECQKHGFCAQGWTLIER